MDYQQVITDLQRAYSRESASGRDQAGKEDWKVAERQHFLESLEARGKENTAGNRSWDRHRWPFFPEERHARGLHRSLAGHGRTVP